MNGFLSINKPAGMSSGQVVGRIKHMLPAGTRVGHAGTLDPQATGVLPVMVGRATRLFDYTTDKEKAYLVEFVPGIETDTQDMTGTVLKQGRSDFTQAEIEAVLPSFIGDIRQVPPMFSALKRDGKRLYELARAGEQIDLEPRTVHISEITVKTEKDDGHFLLNVTCGRGTYMRTLCHDLGRALCSCGCMGALVRTAAGPFKIETSVKLEDVTPEGIEEMLFPMDYPLLHFPRTDIPEMMEERHVRAGVPIPCKDAQIPDGVPVRVYWQDRFCGLARREGTYLMYDCMLLE